MTPEEMKERQEKRNIVRAIFAGLAMHAAVSRNGLNPDSYSMTPIVKASYDLADKMVEESGL